MTDRLTKGTLVWASAKVGDKEATRRILKMYGHLWRVDAPSRSDPDWYWCYSYEGRRTYDFHVSELTEHYQPHHPAHGRDYDREADQAEHDRGVEEQ